MPVNLSHEWWAKLLANMDVHYHVILRLNDALRCVDQII